MSYRDAFRRRFPVASLTLADWATLSAATAAAVATLIFLFHMIAWAIGWPGPLLGFGSANRLRDIAEIAAAVGVSLFIFNILGAAALRICFHVTRLLRRR